MRRTYRVDLAYDGAAFWGYARHPDKTTVESTLREALAPLVGKVPTVVVAGRTDRGVSAVHQVVSFRSDGPIDRARIEVAIDRACPDALVTLGVREMSRSFHAQFSARARRYVHFVDADIDVARADRMLAALVGRRDLHAFARDTPKNKSTIRNLFDARVRHAGKGLRFDYGADGFLRRQIRVLTATVLEQTVAGADDDCLVRIAAERDRRNTANPLPPAGLFLARVIY